MTSRRADERGQGTAEYVGIVAFAALLVVALLAVTVQLSSEAKNVASTAYCKISSAVGGGGSCGGDAGDPGADGKPDDPTDPTDEPNPEPEQRDLPEGLDPDDEVTQALLATEDSRALLQWLHDYDIEVVLVVPHPGLIAPVWLASQSFGDPEAACWLSREGGA